MGYIKVDVKQKEVIKTFSFFYGAYKDGKWNAKLVEDDNNKIEFSYRTINECYSELTGLLRSAGKVKKIVGSPIENSFISGLEHNLNMN